MNHLAHALLAIRSDTSLVGNLLGDFVKGRAQDQYGGELLRGIRVHRAVDAFVDEHPAFARTRARFLPPRRRYAGILADVGYDHVLAREWERWGEGSLEDFARHVYAELTAARSELPPRMLGFVDYMISTDLLASYRERHGLARALSGMARRMGRPNPLAQGIEDLEREAAGLSADFAELFPAAVIAARDAARRW